MRIATTRLEGPTVIEPTAHSDERGFFVETYRREWHQQAGIAAAEDFLQDNHSRSCLGVVRGMHFQIGSGVAKLVRCVRGSIFDVIVDIRSGSPTHGQWEAIDLDDVNHRTLFVPVGFAHGFCVTSEVADVVYKQTAYYDPALERGIAFDDPDIGIDWPFDRTELIPSARDAAAPRLHEIAGELPFVYRPSAA